MKFECPLFSLITFFIIQRLDRSGENIYFKKLKKEQQLKFIVEHIKGSLQETNISYVKQNEIKA